MNCRLQLVAEESQSWFHPEGGIDGQAGPLASWHHQNKQRALSGWLAKFQGGQWTAGEVVAVETPRRHDQNSQATNPRRALPTTAEGTHPSPRENHGQRHPPALFWLSCVSVVCPPHSVSAWTRRRPSLYSFPPLQVCLFRPLDAGPGIHFARLLTLKFGLFPPSRCLETRPPPQRRDDNPRSPYAHARLNPRDSDMAIDPNASSITVAGTRTGAACAPSKAPGRG